MRIWEKARKVERDLRVCEVTRRILSQDATEEYDLNADQDLADLEGEVLAWGLDPDLFFLCP